MLTHGLLAVALLQGCSAAALTSPLQARGSTPSAEEYCNLPNTPCEALGQIMLKCGIKADPETPVPSSSLSPADEQKCFCNSDYFENNIGCHNCERLHGQDNPQPEAEVSASRSQYCTGPKTVGLADFFVESGNKGLMSDILSQKPYVTGSNVLGTKTDVSYYFTSGAVPASTGVASNASTKPASSGATPTSGAPVPAPTAGNTTVAASNGAPTTTTQAPIAPSNTLKPVASGGRRMEGSLGALVVLLAFGVGLLA